MKTTIQTLVLTLALVLLTACGSKVGTVDIEAPIFTSSPSAFVAENQTAAITLAATDASTITYSISGGDSADFSIGSSTGVVTFNAAPDYETKTSYVFTATATDAAGNAQTQDVTITITDIDEIAPVFTSAATATVAENQTAAITLAATDASTITYSISGGDSTSFNVNQSTGEVTFNTAPDYETKTSYIFTATATDAAGNAQTQDVTITITDIDEIAPVFTSAATATVAENQTAAITLAATDASTVTYSISGGDSTSFNVNQSTGEVTFNTAPDYETKTSYAFTATATDAVDNAARQDVTITILNDACTGGDVISHLGTDYCVVTSPYTGKVWLDRNLGATMVCSKSRDDADAGFTDATYAADQRSCFGDYYQWGRNFDGHENNESNITAIQATQIDPVQSEVEGKFITADDTNDYDWAKAIDANGSIRQANWSKTDGSSVCPEGFRVPTLDEFKAELSDAESAEIQDRNDAFNSFLKLPPAGDHSIPDGSMDGVGSWGSIWARLVDGVNSLGVGFGSDNVVWGHASRAYGLSVRCIED